MRETRAERRAYTRPCPDCAEPAHQQCKSKTGRPLRHPHRRRMPGYRGQHPAQSAEVVLTRQRTRFAHWVRYGLSNGWFIDGATVAHAHYGGDKYSVFEPGGDPSGCAALRGSAPTLKLAVAVANGYMVCGQSLFGCREVATGRRETGGGWVYHCAKHQAPGETYEAVTGGE